MNRYLVTEILETLCITAIVMIMLAIIFLLFPAVIIEYHHQISMELESNHTEED